MPRPLQDAIADRISRVLRSLNLDAVFTSRWTMCAEDGDNGGSLERQSAFWTTTGKALDNYDLDQKIQSSLICLFNKLDRANWLAILYGNDYVIQAENNDYFRATEPLLEAAAMLDSRAVEDGNSVWAMSPSQHAKLYQRLAARSSESGIPATMPYHEVLRNKPVLVSSNLPHYQTGTRLQKSGAAGDGLDALTLGVKTTPTNGTAKVDCTVNARATVKKGEWVKFKGIHYIPPASYYQAPLEFTAQVTEDASANSAGDITLKLNIRWDNGNGEGTASQNVSALPVAGSRIEFFGDPNSTYEMSVLVARNCNINYNQAPPVTPHLGPNPDDPQGKEIKDLPIRLTYEYKGCFERSETIHKVSSLNYTETHDRRRGFTFIGRKLQ